MGVRLSLRPFSLNPEAWAGVGVEPGRSQKSALCGHIIIFAPIYSQAVSLLLPSLLSLPLLQAWC